MPAGLTVWHPFATLRVVLARTTIALCTCLCLLGADWPKWRARRREGSVPNRYAAALLDPSSWAPEPESPSSLELPRFARALRRVCARLSSAKADQYAAWIDESAQMHGEDPFLLAALISRQSQCLGDAEEVSGIGLTGIQPEMYRSNVEVDMLQYVVREGDAWSVRAKMLSRPLTPKTLENPQANVEWAAALLSMWREQHDAIDAQFEQAPHRHYVSHFLWGDRVQSARAEDGVFIDRRRLLQHYGQALPVATREFKRIEWGAPLEGSPRLVSSKPGADRDKGLRMHRGVDVDAAMNEPVLAMADGRVTFAGVDLPGRGTAVYLSPENIGQVRSQDMGAGGRYVCITHAPSSTSNSKASAFAPDPPVTAVPRASDNLADGEETEDVDGSPTDKPAEPRAAEQPAAEATKRVRIELAPTEIVAVNPDSLMVSCYMHLEQTRVSSGDIVKRGDVIGTVGRTGCRESPAHLHLELKSEHDLYDARDVLTGILIGDPPWRSSSEERRARKRARAEGLTSRAMSEDDGESLD
jgi:murein DD-endopeptidase MepM/ murein hydrolase activator NlpD